MTIKIKKNMMKWIIKIKAVILREYIFFLIKYIAEDCEPNWMKGLMKPINASKLKCKPLISAPSHFINKIFKKNWDGNKNIFAENISKIFLIINFLF